ncbi:hypothetical protein WK66_29325 [Burkholderia ubonensis]|nr:hypothetical protein WK66_29325 [Burkholderia ubonensis]
MQKREYVRVLPRASKLGRRQGKFCAHRFELRQQTFQSQRLVLPYMPKDEMLMCLGWRPAQQTPQFDGSSNRRMYRGNTRKTLIEQ